MKLVVKKKMVSVLDISFRQIAPYIVEFSDSLAYLLMNCHNASFKSSMVSADIYG